ncbi:MAG: alpha/beta fold hydrolase [Pseudomonadota bacterium]
MTAFDPCGTAHEVTGPPDAPAVVLVHGLGLTRAVWQWMVPDLDGRFRVVTYDLAGHGASARPAGRPALGDLARQLSALLDHLGIARAAVVGFSLGGMVARRFAQDHPDRTAALAILNSPHRRTAAEQAAVLARVALAEAAGPAATVEAALSRWYTDACRASRPDLVDLTRSWVIGNDPGLYPGPYRILADGVEEVVAPSPPIGCPTLVLTAEADRGNGPHMAAAIAGEIAGSRLVILPGLRHLALVEDPAAVNRPVAAFLTEVLS